MTFFGIDIGTSSTKAVVVAPDGTVLRTAAREHAVRRPHVGHVEMDAAVWWAEFVSLAEELTGDLADDPTGDLQIDAVGVSGMGPCVLVTDVDGDPLRPAILYGVDTRATRQIAELTDRFGEDEILARTGSVLTTQAVGPKLAWLAEHEPDVHRAARRLFMPSSWLAYRLTGAYYLDFHSASQCTPLFDAERLDWYGPWVREIAPHLELPPLAWPGDLAGRVLRDVGGIRAGTPVTVGTIDAWSEAVSVGAVRAGDLMIMYGTTMFLIATVPEPLRVRTMWGTVGVYPDTRNLAGGLATSGAVTAWLRDLLGGPTYPELLAEADASGPGARGLVMLPYFAGERTPILDPDARGAIVGLTVTHTRGDLYRAALEATAFAVRHNIDAMTDAGARLSRVVAVGGGTQGGLWTRIISDVTGRTQVLPRVTMGACFGAAFLAAGLVSDVSIERWNPPSVLVEPDPRLAGRYAELYGLYRDLYPSTRDISHALAALQRTTT
jgi:xylulokinase